jgi:2-dehydro-3-deoxyphosphogluconate aldolase/(4S)-4-hydroxy-2-oxoglutarate aldolase
VVILEEPFPSGIVGIVRTDDSETAFRAAVAGVEGGLQTIQVSMTAPDALDIARGVAASTGARVGVGSVTDPKAVALARKARIPFVATPFLQPEVAAAARREGIVCVIGATTPSEVFQAVRAGAAMVDVFPIESMGGPNYVRWLREPFPTLPLWASGGVEFDDIPEYLELDVVVGLTAGVFPAEALRRGDFAAIRELAARATALSPRPVWG